jgi:pimeloyl-ACP methyl ester carboxylesterase
MITTRFLKVFLLLMPAWLVLVSRARAELFEVAPQVKIYYESSGQGEPLLLIPGWTMTSGIWKEQVAEFSKTHRVIAMDPRSHGNSTKVLAGNSLNQQARDLRKLIEGLQLDRVTVVGWSMAVSVLLEYVNQFGNDRLKGLVLVDGNPLLLKKEDWPYGLTQEELHKWLTDFENDRAMQLNRFVDEMFKTDRSDSELEWIVKECSRTPTTIATVLFYDMAALDRRPYLAKISVPTLIAMAGEHKEMGETIKNKIVGAKLSVFEGLGHALFLEDPRKFNDVMSTFLKSLQ